MLLMPTRTEKPADIMRFYLDIPRDAHRRLRYAAALRGVTMKQIVMDCIERLPEPPKDGQPSRADVERLKARPARETPGGE